MLKLPLIVAQGGIGPAGRTSGFHGYCRLVLNALGHEAASNTLTSLASLTGITPDNSEQLLASTLIRRINESVVGRKTRVEHHRLSVKAGTTLEIDRRRLPRSLPAAWRQESDKEGSASTVARLRAVNDTVLLLPDHYALPVHAAGQLPTGFAPETLYPSRKHPRGLAMTVYGASDAIGSLGIDWKKLQKMVRPDRVAVYAGSSMGQLDQHGSGGLLQARLRGQRVSAKQLPLGFAEMPADFVNAYVLGNLGITGTSMGACATFLYNLRHAIEDIQCGRVRVALVGNSEAPIVPEIIDGFASMGAIATDHALRQLDGLSEQGEPDWNRACRPFAENCGFTLAESAQFFVLMDDELALATGADVLAAAAGVFVHADGPKKSIAGPGAGNYITVARACALARSIVGQQGLQHRSFVQAHGSGTPQNRVTESAILDEVAKAFGIEQWPVTAVKSYVGHSLATAAADQLFCTLGAWRHSLIPAIANLDSVAHDVSCDRLHLLKKHHAFEQMDAALINAKGFGGNNATATLLAPGIAKNMLAARHGKSALKEWEVRREEVLRAQKQYEQTTLSGQTSPRYSFGEGVIEPGDIEISADEIRLAGAVIPLSCSNPYAL